MINNEQLIREIEQFLYQEARLLDNKQFKAWLELFTEDARYWMPVRSNKYPKNSKAISILDGSRYEEEELSKEGELAILDETKETLSMRITRLETGMAWAEDPPSRTRHMISNVEVEELTQGKELKVYSNFLVYRNRGEREQDFFVGSREDTVRKTDGQWKIAYRKVVLDQNVLLHGQAIIHTLNHLLLNGF